MASELPAVAFADRGENGEGELHGPLRRCIVTRQVLPKERLIRFVVGPEGVIVPDLEGRLPGRGLWLQARRDVVETACDKGSFAKAARSAVKVPEGLADRLAIQLRRRCLDFIGLARRAGQVASGSEQVRAWLREGRAGVLIAAVDGAEGGRSKMAALGRELPMVALFSAAELGASLGREQAVHVAIARGTLARRFIVEALRLAGFEPKGGVTLPSVDAAEFE